MSKKSEKLLENFPKKIKELRQQKGWSQGQVAEKIDADPRRVSKYERGLVSPTTEVILKLANAFEVSTDYLLRDNYKEEIEEFKNKRLLTRIKRIDELSEKDQNLLIDLLDIFIRQRKIEEIIKKSDE